MNGFWLGSGLTLLLVVPIVLLFVFTDSGSSTTPSVESANTLDQPGQLPDKIFTVNENCLNEIATVETGAVSADCQHYETQLNNEFISQVEEAINNQENIECAKNLPKDLSALDKKFEGNKAQIIIEGQNIVEGKEEDAEDLQVEFTKIENDWEISDIRCLE